MCSLGNFNEDNGYKYILDELKTTRAQIDNVIDIIEKRIEKDAIINDVINTDYDDECDCATDSKKEESLPVDEIIKAIAIQNALRGWKYPYRTTTWF